MGRIYVIILIDGIGKTQFKSFNIVSAETICSSPVTEHKAAILVRASKS